MKLKNVLALGMTAAMAMSLAACGGSAASSATSATSAASSAASAASSAVSEAASSAASSAAASSGSEAKPAGGNFKIGFANSSLDNPWRVGIQNAVENAVAQYDGVEFVTNQADEDAVTLISNVEDLISSGCDIILVCTVDGDTFQPAVEACSEAGVPLMFLDRGITTSDDYLSYVQQSNVQIGADSADWLAEQLTAKNGSAKGKVVELQGVAGNLPAEERHKGFTDRLAEKYPEIEVIYSQNTDYSRANSLQVMENIIQGADEFDAVFTHEDEIAIGAIQALEEANRLDGVLIIGDGGSRDAMNYIKEGKLTMTITYSPVDFGTVGVRAAMDYLNGNEIDHNIQITGQIVDSSNVDEMISKMDEAGTDFAFFAD